MLYQVALLPCNSVRIVLSIVSGGIGAESGYTEASCVKPGNEVYIELTSTYVPLTPFASTFLPGNPGGIDVNEAVSMIIE